MHCWQKKILDVFHCTSFKSYINRVSLYWCRYRVAWLSCSVMRSSMFIIECYLNILFMGQAFLYPGIFSSGRGDTCTTCKYWHPFLIWYLSGDRFSLQLLAQVRSWLRLVASLMWSWFRKLSRSALTRPPLLQPQEKSTSPAPLKRYAPDVQRSTNSIVPSPRGSKFQKQPCQAT